MLRPCRAVLAATRATGNVTTDDLVDLLHREGTRTGVDGVRLPAARDELAVLVGHRLDSALAALGVAPALLVCVSVSG